MMEMHKVNPANDKDLESEKLHINFIYCFTGFPLEVESRKRIYIYSYIVKYFLLRSLEGIISMKDYF